MNILDRIKELAKKRGLSISQVEEDCGLAANSIYSWTKRNPGVDKVQSVANYFDVSVDYLLGNTDSPSPIPAADKVPDWATDTDVSKWVEFIDNDRQNELNYGGVPLTEEERQQLNVALATIFWKHRKQDNEQGR